MAGAYFHIPFCHQACDYCNFHFLASKKYINEYVDALLTEISLRKDYFRQYSNQNLSIESIYFGGGTPSLLPVSFIDKLISELAHYFKVNNSIEVTIECNPEDITADILKEYSNIGINRISLGVQSFFDDDLKYLHRKHTSKKAKEALEAILQSGISNVSVDLIYGIPFLTNQKWESNIQNLLNYKVPHISAYCLTVEPKTPLAWKISKQRVANIDEQQGAEQFEIIVDTLMANNYQHYEISNFAIENYQSKHNTSYWKNIPYIGFGTSAHSFDGFTRQWNIRNVQAYINAVKNNKPFFEKEKLTENDIYNEYILTHLRTSWGIDLSVIERKFGSEKINLIQNTLQKYESNKYFQQLEGVVTLTKQGKLMCDWLTQELFSI